MRSAVMRALVATLAAILLTSTSALGAGLMRKEEPLTALGEEDVPTRPFSFLQESEIVDHASGQKRDAKDDGGVARQLENFTSEISDAARQFASKNMTQMIGFADKILMQNITANLTFDVTVNLSTLATLDKKFNTSLQELQSQTGVLTDMMSLTATELSGTLRPQTFVQTAVFVFVVVVMSSIAVCRMGWCRGSDPSVRFYSTSSKSEKVVCESADLSEFREVFNQPPMIVCLRVIGRRTEPQGMRRYVGRLGGSVQFDVSLDLKPFITSGQISEKDLQRVSEFIKGANMMEVLTIEKRIRWKGLDEVRSSIRKRMSDLGFAGKVDILFEGDENVVVCHNHRWSNFLRRPATQLLMGISVVGGVFLIPYVWIKGRHKSIESTFRIDVQPAQYWDLVSAGFDAQRGFEVK